MGIFAPATIIGRPIGSDYQIARSLRLRLAASAYLTRTFGANPTTRTKCHLNFKIKRTGSGAIQVVLAGYDGSSAWGSHIYFNAADQFAIDFGGATQLLVCSTNVYRDLNAWYTVDIAIDTTQTTAALRVLMWVNGALITSFATANYPAQNAVHQFALANGNNRISALWNGTQNYIDCCLADPHFIDGTPMTAGDFGQTDPVMNVWMPKKYAGTYGTNGWRLDFSDNSAATAAAIGADRSGNGNNWTPTNVSVTAGVTNDSSVDVPNNYGIDTGAGGEVRGNYCVMNALDKNARVTIYAGNLTVTGDSTANHSMVRGGFGMSSGKWYWEVTVSGLGSTSGGPPVDIVGIQDAQQATIDTYYVGASGVGCGRGYNAGFSNIYQSGFTISGTAPALENATMGFAYDADTGKLWFRNSNGTWVQGSPSAGTSPSATMNTLGTVMLPALSLYGTSPGTWIFNFGQTPFVNAAPTGFKALCTQNLPDPLITKPGQYFNPVIYTGTGAARSVTGVGFQPDVLWIKSRSNITSLDHAMLDASRGAGKYLYPNLNSTEGSFPTDHTSFDADGFSFGAGSGSLDNQSTYPYVGWNWKKGAVPGVDVQLFTSPSSAGTATINHSLGAVPAMFILKQRGLAAGWYSNHKGLANQTDQYITLGSTAAVNTLSWGGAPTSTQIFIATGFTSTSILCVVYLFAEVPGFSRFGRYIGNGVVNGGFAWCGFRPRFVMIKRADTTGNWLTYDTTRSPINLSTEALYPSQPWGEGADANHVIDILANGFKTRGTGADINTNGGNYIFAAFAESPFKYARAR